MQKNLNWDDLRFFLEVARAGTASAASRRLSVDYTTVARRIRSLEEGLGALLFDKSRSTGFTLTVDGQHLLRHAETMEAAMEAAHAEVSGTGSALSGHVRIGCTEAFGTYFVAPQMANFQDHYPNISIDVLPVPHFVSLSRREADIAITLERTARGPYVTSKLCDYRLKLYATPDYLAHHPRISSVDDLKAHDFIHYVEALAFSPQLLYLNDIVANARSRLRCTSTLAQYHAALQGRALAILPCFVAEQDPRLVAVLADTVRITRHFWLSYSEDLRRLKRVTEVAHHLIEAAHRQKHWLMGELSAL